MKHLLDADSAIDYLAGQPGIHAIFPHLLRDDLAISGTTFVELYSGVYGARDPKQAERDLRRCLRSVRVLPISRRVLLETARLRHELATRRAPIKHRAYDLMTAATALGYGLTLVTSNERDFADIIGLRRLNPRSASSS